MTKEFEWNSQLGRRARSEFGCIECGVKEGIYRQKHLHKDGCSFGVNLSKEEKKRRIEEWEKKLQAILECEEKEYKFKKPAQKCSVCKTMDATGTVWVSYHDDSVALIIISNYICCDECALPTPRTWSDGRKWGFAWGVVTKKKWELMDFLENAGVVK